MSNPVPAPSQTPVHKREFGNGLVFWILVLMAVGAFTPCVLLPEWRTYQALRTAEQAQQHRLDTLQSVVDRDRRLYEAMRSDPAVIARAAQRTLRFRRPGEVSVLLSAPVPGNPAEEQFVPDAVLAPPLLARGASYLPSYDYDAVFCDDRTRSIVMVMSVTLLIVALCLPVPRS